MLILAKYKSILTKYGRLNGEMLDNAKTISQSNLVTK